MHGRGVRVRVGVGRGEILKWVVWVLESGMVERTEQGVLLVHRL